MRSLGIRRTRDLAGIALLFVMISDPSGRALIQQKAIVSLQKIFNDSISVSTVGIHLSKEERQQIAEQSTSSWNTDSLSVLVCKNNATIAGYGVIDDVKGKTQFITYLTVVNTQGIVLDVDVLAYRESYGGEIQYESFRKQFRNKSAHDALHPGKEIKNISGATISVRSITYGVKRVIATFDLIKGRLP